MISRENPRDDMFRILFETAGEGLVVVNKSGIIDIINPRMEELFGYNRKDMIGQPIEMLIPMNRKKIHQDHRDDYFQKPKKRPMGGDLNLFGQRKDGTQFPIEVSLNHFRRDDESYVMALVTDVTERKKAEFLLKEINVQLEEKVEERTEELKQSQALYSTIARRYPNGSINVFDKDLNYVFAEGQGLYSMGITSKHLVGTHYLDRVPVELRKDIEQKLRSALQGRDQSFELNLEDRHYLLNAVGLRNNKGEIDQILVVEQNITHQKKAERDVRSALEREKELGELKSRFVSMASHEFRTPLGTILSSTNLLEKYTANSKNDEKTAKHIKRIKTSIQNLTTILDDFLSLDKLTAGKIEARLTQFGLAAFVEDVVDEIREAMGGGVEVSYEHISSNDEIESDQNILKNIIHNLLTNAIKYSKAEGGKVRMESKLGKKWAKLRVVDNGIGINKAEQKHLFERFFRAQNVENIQGTGLGLHIVKKYLDLLGGKITFESEEGKGSEFIVTIPIKSSHEN